MPEPIADEKMYTVAEVAELWAVSDDHVRRLIADEKLRARRTGRLIRIPASAVREYVDGEDDPPGRGHALAIALLVAGAGLVEVLEAIS